MRWGDNFKGRQREWRSMGADKERQVGESFNEGG